MTTKAGANSMSRTPGRMPNRRFAAGRPYRTSTYGWTANSVGESYPIESLWTCHRPTRREGISLANTLTVCQAASLLGELLDAGSAWVGRPAGQMEFRPRHPLPAANVGETVDAPVPLRSTSADTRDRGTLKAPMSTDTKAIIGTIVGTGLVVAGLLSAQLSGVNTRIDDLRTELKTEIAVLRDDVRGMDARLRDVEIAFGKVDQRLLTIERTVLPGPAAGE